jgi:hypothetical protein
MPLYRPSRRDILAMAAAAPALALPAAGRAQVLGAPESANPSHFRFTLGEATLTVVSDGRLEIPANGLGINADPEEVKAFLESYFLSTETNYSHTNHLVIDTGSATVLVDVGSGSRFLPTAGELIANLEAAGIDPGDITHVIITHAHPDHVWASATISTRRSFPTRSISSAPPNTPSGCRTGWSPACRQTCSNSSSARSTR